MNDNYDFEYPANYEHTGKLPNFRFSIGDRVVYTNIFGESSEGTITSRGKHDDYDRLDIVYTVKLDDGDHRWGYTDQFEPI